MKPTNYHLFDFLDFDTELSRNESLWKAYKPTAVYEKEGDIYVTVPFQKQKLANDMMADTDVPQEEYTLIIRQYNIGITRLFLGFGDYVLTDESEMLQFSDRIQKVPLFIKEQKGKWILSTEDGTKRAVINVEEPLLDRWSELLPDPQETLDITLYPDGKREIRLSAYDHFSPPRYDALPVAFCKRDGRKERATLSFECKPDECFAGTGERFFKMDLSGQTFFLKNQDGQGVNNRRTYKNIPFYLSSRMYGTFYHTCAHSKLSLAGHSTRSVQFLSDQALLDVFVIGGDTMEDILRGYRDLTGYPSMPPLWSFGVWMSRMTYFSADEVDEICDRMRAEHYPCDVIHLDTGWFRTDWLCEWKFNEERFPDPKGFIGRLKKNGYRVSLWQLPYVAENAEQIDEARANDYIAPLTKQQATDGSNFSALDYAGTIDFTYPKATEWYKGLLKQLLDMGVTCIKTDFGENIHMDALYKGMKPDLLNNLYALLYQKAAYEITKEVTGDGIVWARSAWAGSQRYPLHWGGDAATTETGFEGTIRSGLSIGLSGFCFWSNDIGGFVTQSPESLYRRWLPFGFLTSHSRVHGAPPTEPWYYGKEFTDYFRRCAELKYKLMPYVYAQSKECTENGWPMLRALLLEYPDDPGAWLVEDEYMFGSNLLVAPMLEEGSGRDVYLPGRQKWIDYQTGKVYAPGWNHIECGTLPIIILVKDGSAIPHIPVAQCTDQMKWDKITWKKYLADEKKAEGLLCLPQDGRLQRMSIP
mgnify:CR=1 FL=1